MWRVSGAATLDEMSQKTARKQRASARAPAPPSSGSRGAVGGLRRRWLYAGLGIAVLAVVAVLISVSQLGGGEDEPPPLSVAGERTEELLAGIEQDGVSLGAPEAPVLLIEFADLQCPFCAQYATTVLPTLIDEYVRTGDVRLVFRGISFIGPDSEKALRAVLAAGLQNKLWNAADLMYLHQGGENEGWVTDELIRAIGEAIPGLDVDRMIDDMDSEAVEQDIANAAQEADVAGINRTPTFLAGREGGQLERLDISELEPDAFREELDRLLAE
jgi:protein-disulfide isomerase